MCKTGTMTCGKLRDEVRRSQSCRSYRAEPRKLSQVHFNPLPKLDDGDGAPAFRDATERLRNFESTKHGRIVNRGDSFRGGRAKPCLRRRETVRDARVEDNPNNLQRSVTMPQMPDPLREVPTETRRVLLLGTSGVGKTALCHQFQTSEYTNGADNDALDDAGCCVTVCLNGTETGLTVQKRTCSLLNVPDENTVRMHDALLVVYSVVDPPSFCAARGLCHLISSMAVRRPVILVASKCDLVRLRKVTAKDGRALAVEFGFKYIETSVVINSNIDELLAGIVAQIRFYNQFENPSNETEASKPSKKQTRRVKYRKARTLPSLIVKEILHKVIGQKEIKPCDDLMTI